MEQKNLKREVVKQRFVRSLGCNLILFPVTILTVSIFIYLAWLSFKLYFFGDAEAFLEPYQNKSYLVIFGLIVITIFGLLQSAWQNAILFRRNISRYITMKQEESRIESLIPQSKAETTAEIHKLEYFEEAEKYKHSR